MGFVMTTFSSVTLSISFHFPICKENPFFLPFFFITVRKHSMCDFDKIRKGAENTEERANGQGSRAVTKHCWCLLIGQNYYFFFHVKNIVRASDWPRLVLLTMPFQWVLQKFSFFSLLQRSTAKPDPQSLVWGEIIKLSQKKTPSYLNN